MSDTTPRDQERWLPVVGYEGLYEVSDQGRVRSIGRLDRTNHMHAPCVLKEQPEERTGHRRVYISVDGVKSYLRVHRAVLEAFVGPCPEDMEACHWNDDPSDNRLENLRWDTKKANRQDCVRNGHDPNASKTHCKRGHAFTPENTYLLGNSRSCRVCQRERSRLYKERTSRKIPLPATVLWEPEEGE